jgi:ubiquinone/menaquinone biosynthesis C-methylase UbiE
MFYLYAIFAILITLLAIGLSWRWLSKRRQLPCPAWMAWILDNPLTAAVAGSQTTLDRLGVLPGECVLDIGCGSGRLSLPAAQRVGPTGEVYALDIQSKMLARLQDRIDKNGVTNIMPHLADITVGCNIPSNQFDRALLVTVLGELPDRLAGLRNVYQALKPGGVLSVTEIFPDPHYQRRSSVLRLCREVGFVPSRFWGTALAFTQNFIRP